MSNQGANPDGPRALHRRVKAVSFWVGVGLPVLYLPLLVAGAPGFERPVAVALVALHALALVVGHTYGTDG
jgi:hypothetical protein